MRERQSVKLWRLQRVINLTCGSFWFAGVRTWERRKEQTGHVCRRWQTGTHTHWPHFLHCNIKNSASRTSCTSLISCLWFWRCKGTCFSAIQWLDVCISCFLQDAAQSLKASLRNGGNVSSQKQFKPSQNLFESDGNLLLELLLQTRPKLCLHCLSLSAALCH